MHLSVAKSSQHRPEKQRIEVHIHRINTEAGAYTSTDFFLWFSIFFLWSLVIDEEAK